MTLLLAIGTSQIVSAEAPMPEDPAAQGYPIPSEYRPSNAPGSYSEDNANVRIKYTYKDFWLTVGDIAKVLISVSGMLAVYFIIDAAFKYVTSGGRQEPIDAAKNTLKWAFLGLITVLLSYALVDFAITMVQNIAVGL